MAGIISTKKAKKPKVLVALSGGVDSAVAAALLIKQDYQVEAAFMKNYTHPIKTRVGLACPWQDDLACAREVAKQLGIRLHIFNFELAYYEKVVRNFFNEYAAGNTPNPDALCNREIKFGLFLKQARRLDFQKVATGHYAQVKTKVSDPTQTRFLRGVDLNKDQSYFMALVRPDQLERVILPIGAMIKPRVRQLAREFGLPNANRKDSQGICFIGPVKVNQFLRSYLPVKKGQVMTTDNQVVGQHDGAWFYTIGQRHGLGLGADLPYYVVGKSVKNNTLTVSLGPEDSALYSREFRVRSLNIIARASFDRGSISCQVQTRYRQQPIAGTVFPQGAKQAKVILKEPIRAVTPGQVAVFYTDNEVLAGGTIVLK